MRSRMDETRLAPGRVTVSIFLRGDSRQQSSVGDANLLLRFPLRPKFGCEHVKVFEKS